MPILLSFFAAVGMVYLLRDLFWYLVYRKKRPSHWLLVDLEGVSRREFCAWMQNVSQVQDSFGGRALLRGVCLVPGAGLSLEEAENIARIFGVPVKEAPPRQSPFAG